MMLSLPRPETVLASFGRVLPPSLVSLHISAGLELARLCRWLTPPPELDGRTFAMTVSDIGLRSSFCCRNGQFRPYWGDMADLELSASVADFVSMARGDMDADTLFFQRRLKISGDTELGLVVKNWLDASERPAWLKHLPRPLQRESSP